MTTKEFRALMRAELQTKFAPVDFYSRLVYAWIICTETISAALFTPYHPEADETATK